MANRDSNQRPTPRKRPSVREQRGRTTTRASSERPGASRQRQPAHKFADAGADVILGNHPHVMEGIEFYNGSLIAYAHGNCVFWQKYDNTHESYVLDFNITENGVKDVTATPLYLDDTYGIPSVATGAQAQTQLERLEEISTDMNSQFEIRDGKAYITPAS